MRAHRAAGTEAPGTCYWMPLPGPRASPAFCNRARQP